MSFTAMVVAVNGQAGVVEVVQEAAAGVTATFNALPGDAAFWSVTPDGSSSATRVITLGQVYMLRWLHTQ